MRYRYNRSCPCPRCRAHGYMGPAVLITIGVLFLLDQMGHTHWMDFSYTWPALLIVIGVVMLLTHSASIDGHIPREYNWQSRDQRYVAPPNPGQQVPPGYQGYPPQGPVQPQAPIVTPPSSAPAGFIAPSRPDDKEERNG
jgi:hypothetical protein